MFGLNAHKDEENLVAGAGFAPGCPARRPSGHARQLLLHCSTSCIHAVVRMSKIALCMDAPVPQSTWMCESGLPAIL